MGNKASLMLQSEEIKQISDYTGFSPAQIEKLYSRFAHLDRASCGTLTKNDFLSIPELAINPLCDRLLQMFFADCLEGDEPRINFKQFISVLATFRPTSSATNGSKPGSPSNNNTNNNYRHHQNHRRQHNHRQQLIANLNDNLTDHLIKNESLKERLLFVFKIYDLDDDGQISFNDLKSVLKMMVGNFIEEVQLNKIASRAFAEIDKDNNGFIDFQEFCHGLKGKDLDDKLRIKFF